MNTTKTNQRRTLKVYSRLIIPPYGKAVKFPEIRLMGNWLRLWGFECGTNIIVTRTDSAIIIRRHSINTPTVQL